MSDSLNSWSHTYIPTLWRPLGIVIDRYTVDRCTYRAYPPLSHVV